MHAHISGPIALKIPSPARLPYARDFASQHCGNVYSYVRHVQRKVQNDKSFIGQPLTGPCNTVLDWARAPVFDAARPDGSEEAGGFYIGWRLVECP
jgi:hypothetical protein